MDMKVVRITDNEYEELTEEEVKQIVKEWREAAGIAKGLLEEKLQDIRKTAVKRGDYHIVALVPREVLK